MYGGDVTDITFNNSEVGSGTLKAKSGEGNTYDPGGVRNTGEGNITSDGTRIQTKNMKPGFFKVLIANDMNQNKDAEKLVALAKSLAPTTWTFTIINGKTYRGVGDVMGDIQPDIDKATVSLHVEAAEFKQI
jgi:hypothetical protein